VTPKPGADDALLIPQWSTDLVTWQNTNFTLLSTEPLIWTLPNRTSSKAFYRIKIELRQPPQLH
jgi:hypothetical protein